MTSTSEPGAHYAVSAIGRDRPGIVAAISEALLALNGNIEDSRMAILRGHFAVMLIVSLPAGVGREELEGRLAPLREQLGLEAVSVGEVEPLAAATPAATHVLSVYGADHPGIVHTVTSTLAERGANVIDLQTRLTGEGEKALYVMVLELTLAGEADTAALEAALAAVAEAAQIEVSLRPLETEAL
ncbi:MAG: glycine cleavage system transcriptional repressor [Solirubrobacterales bacterium]|nr:glycine cleavage system transcriptional repressor [Solirubrobacterales bacterium]MDX6662500.1 glycine cleavage system transcriptional repressor [Solirubrobacterales bacterium]